MDAKIKKIFREETIESLGLSYNTNNLTLLKKKKLKTKCKKFKNWNYEEDELLSRLFNIYGNKWKIIVKYFPNRTAYQLNYRLQQIVKNKDQQENNSSPDTTQTDSKHSFSYKKNKKSNFQIHEKKFFENLEKIKFLFKSLTQKKSSYNTAIFYSFSEISDNQQFSNLENDENFDNAQIKQILNYMGFFLKDINNMSNIYKNIDVNNQFLCLQSKVTQTYISLIEFMIVNKKFFI